MNICCRCQAATEAAWAGFRNAWADMHPLSTARRLEALAQLQPLAEVQVRTGLPHTIVFKASRSPVEIWHAFQGLIPAPQHLQPKRGVPLLGTVCQPLKTEAAWRSLDARSSTAAIVCRKG